MPSGSKHNTINFQFLPAFLLLLVSIGFVSVKYSVIFSIGFIFGTLFFDPDLDTHSKSFRRWGIFKFIWLPYQKFFPHRSIFTHGIILGDVIRLTYLSTWLIVLFRLPGEIINFLLPISKQYSREMQLGIVITLLIMILFRKKVSKFMFKRASRISLTLIILIVSILEATKVFSIKEYLFLKYSEDPYSFWYFPLGIILASVLHTVSDILSSALKRLFS